MSEINRNIRINMANVRNIGRGNQNEPILRFHGSGEHYLTEKQFAESLIHLKAYRDKCEPIREEIHKLQQKITEPYYVELTKEK